MVEDGGWEGGSAVRTMNAQSFREARLFDMAERQQRHASTWVAVRIEISVDPLFESVPFLSSFGPVAFNSHSYTMTHTAFSFAFTPHRWWVLHDAHIWRGPLGYSTDSGA